MPVTAIRAHSVTMSSAGSAESTTQNVHALDQTVKKMKRHKKPPQPVNYAQPQWKHAASGIRCRADWKGAYVYDTDAGWIVAYSQAHANDKAMEVIEENLQDECLQPEDMFARLED